MLKKSNVLAVLSMSFLLTACVGGGGGGTNGYESDQFISSKFIDDEVKGLTVERLASGGSVVTGNNGSFSCVPGETLTFKLAGLTLGHAACGNQIFVNDIAFGDDWKKAAVILQSLSSTPAGSGQLDVSAYTNSNDLASVDLTNDNHAAISAALTSAGAPQAIPSMAAAASAAMEVRATLTGHEGWNFVGKTLMSDDGNNDYLSFDQSFYDLENPWIGGLGNTCEEVVVFKTNGTLTISAVQGFEAACETASQAQFGEPYENNFTMNFSILGNGRLEIDGNEYCVVDDQNDSTCNN